MTFEQREPLAVITEFSNLWSAPDLDEIVEYFTEDATYQNGPMAAVVGRAAIGEFIAGFLVECEGIDFVVHQQMAHGDSVLNERTDVVRFKDRGAVALPVMGAFEVRAGRIAVWRDYFDLATLTTAAT